MTVVPIPITVPLGEPAAPPVNVSPDTLKAFLRAGGSITLREWLDFDIATQAASEQAGTAVTAEHIVAIAACFMGAHDQVAAVADGGAAAEEATLSTALTHALSGRKVVRDG